MNIGIDVDGVLINKDSFQLKYGKEFFKKKIINKEEYYIKNIFDLTSEQCRSFWNNYIREYINQNVKDNASSVIEKLSSEGNKIFIITARGFDINSYTDLVTNDYMKEHTKNWLDKNHIIYDKLIFTKESKTKYIVENKIDIMIEDKPINIEEISNYCKTIKYNCTYNNNVYGKNIYSANDWLEIYNIVKQKKM